MRKYERMMREKGAQFPPVLFSCSRILNFADPTTMEPGTGYEKVCILRLQINVFHEKKWKSSQKLELNGFVCKCKCKYLIIHSPQGFSGIIYNTGWGTLPNCLRCSLQVMKDWVMIPPYMSVKVR